MTRECQISPQEVWRTPTELARPRARRPWGLREWYDGARGIAVAFASSRDTASTGGLAFITSYASYPTSGGPRLARAAIRRGRGNLLARPAARSYLVVIGSFRTFIAGGSRWPLGSRACRGGWVFVACHDFLADGRFNGTSEYNWGKTLRDVAGEREKTMSGGHGRVT